MEEITRNKLFESARKMLLAEFEKAKVEVPHYGERGSETELVVINWLNKHLPKRFSACGGFILDDNDKISPQTDVIIYDALNCPILRYSEKNLIIPADNAAVAIEVKSNLTKEALVDASKKIKAVKSLGKMPLSDLDLLSEGAKKIVQRQTLGVVFAFESHTSLRTIGSWYEEIFKQPQYNGGHIDYICVLNKGWIDLAIKVQDGKGLNSILHPEPILRPKIINGPMEIWIGCHESPEKSLLYMLRLITHHLQVFRTKIYIPYTGIFNNECEQIFAIRVGHAPEYPVGYSDEEEVELIKPVMKLSRTERRRLEREKGKNK